MKKYLSIVCTVLLFACGEKKHGAFIVTGNITNADGKKLLLMEYPFNSPQPIVLDSTILKNNQSFTLSGRAAEESIYHLVLDNGPAIILVNDNKSIHINMDVNDYKNYKVDGSPATESLQKLFAAYTVKDSTLLSTFKKMDTLQKNGATDSVINVVRTTRDAELQDLNALIKSFINNSQSAAARFYALGIASRTMPPEALQPMLESSIKKFPGHSGLARIKSMLAVNNATSDSKEVYSLLNQQAPELNMNTPDGKPLSISSFKGKYVLVDFWASWCGPCRNENPNVVAAFNKFKGKNFTILGVSLDKDKAAWQKAIATDQLTWQHMSDLKNWESAAVQAYQFNGIPFNVLLDPQGKIIASGLRGQHLEDKLLEVLK